MLRHPGSRPAPNGQLLPAGEDEDITNETELRKADTRDETLQQMQQRQKETLRRQWKQLARRPRPIWRPSAAVTASVPEH
jgi:hypothetical protein